MGREEDEVGAVYGEEEERKLGGRKKDMKIRKRKLNEGRRLSGRKGEREGERHREVE